MITIQDVCPSLESQKSQAFEIRKSNIRGGNPADCLAIDLMLHMAKHGYSLEDLQDALEKLETKED